MDRKCSVKKGDKQTESSKNTLKYCVSSRVTNTLFHIVSRKKKLLRTETIERTFAKKMGGFVVLISEYKINWICKNRKY